MPATLRDATTFHLAPAVRAELDALAREQDRELGELLGEAVATYLARKQRDANAIKQGLRQAETGDFTSNAEIEAVYASFAPGA